MMHVYAIRKPVSIATSPTAFSGIRLLWDTVFHALTCTISKLRPEFQHHLPATQYLGLFSFTKQSYDYVIHIAVVIVATLRAHH